MRIEYSRDAVKAISKMDAGTKKRIKSGVEGLLQQPPRGDIKRLQGYSDGTSRLRIGGYRVIFRYVNGNNIEILYIVDIGVRGDIYK